MILIPINGLAAFAAGVLKSPTTLLYNVVVVPPETAIPLTVPEALFASRLYTLF